MPAAIAAAKAALADSLGALGALVTAGSGVVTFTLVEAGISVAAAAAEVEEPVAAVDVCVTADVTAAAGTMGGSGVVRALRPPSAGVAMVISFPIRVSSLLRVASCASKP